MMGLPVALASFDHLEHSVRTGGPATQLLDPNGFWSYLEAHPDEAQVFGQAMTAKAAADIARRPRRLRLRPLRHDRRHRRRARPPAARRPGRRPDRRGDPVRPSRRHRHPAVDRDRLTPRAGDFFVDPLPTADAHILMEVIHDLPDAEAAAILTAIRRAASPSARVLIIENVHEDAKPDQRSHTLDVIMLAVTGGRERTGNQLGALLEGAGFSDTTVVHTAGPLRMVEAVAT